MIEVIRVKCKSEKNNNNKKVCEKWGNQQSMCLTFIDLSNHRVRCESEKNTGGKKLLTKTEKKEKIRGDAMCAPRLIPQDS